MRRANGEKTPIFIDINTGLALGCYAVSSEAI